MQHYTSTNLIVILAVFAISFYGLIQGTLTHDHQSLQDTSLKYLCNWEARQVELVKIFQLHFCS